MVIYVSGPYSKGDVSENIRRACLAGDELLNKGHTPLVPHLTHLWHLMSPKSWDTWMRIDLDLLNVCDAVLRLDGESKGADLEVAEAKRLCLFIYYDIKEVPFDKSGRVC